MATAAFLGSIATTIAGLTTDNEAVAIVGVCCGAASAAIYAAAEAYTDGARAKANSTETLTSITASSSSKETVDKVVTATLPTVEPKPAETQSIPPKDFE